MCPMLVLLQTSNHPRQQVLRTFMRPTGRACTDFHNTLEQIRGISSPCPCLARTPFIRGKRHEIYGLEQQVYSLSGITLLPRP